MLVDGALGGRLDVEIRRVDVGAIERQQAQHRQHRQDRHRGAAQPLSRTGDAGLVGARYRQPVEVGAHGVLPSILSRDTANVASTAVGFCGSSVGSCEVVNSGYCGVLLVGVAMSVVGASS